MANENEQWLSDGKCSLCRRQKYCKKQCSANKKQVYNLVQSEFMKALAKGLKQKDREATSGYIAPADEPIGDVGVITSASTEV